MNLQPKHIALVAALLICLVFSVGTGSFAYYVNGQFGFPLDDPWIHLQFAKNVADYGAFSYYKDAMVTSGSTAPLYTLLLAAGFLVTHNEMLLSYALGVAMYLGAVFFFFKLAEEHFQGNWWISSGGALLLAMEPRLQWIALSGMETTLFILLGLAVLYYYRTRKPLGLGLAAGLLIWTRPEAVILFGALATDVVVELLRRRTGKPPERDVWLTKALAITVLFAGAYAAFNLILSGSILPNTYAAKLKYYSGTGNNFPGDVFRYFTSGHMAVLAVLAACGSFLTAIHMLKRQPSPGLIPLVFSIGLFLAYWIKLPYLYQNGRYLMPILPFYLFLGLLGLDWVAAKAQDLLGRLWGWRRQSAVGILVMGILILGFGLKTWEERTSYQEACKYISERQVKTARWINNHLPGEAVVATHDVGALAYYSGRRIVDMVGLVSPEMISRIGDVARLEEFLIQQGVTHLALLRNWYEVVNENPLFQTNELTPEIMEVFVFDTSKVHFTSSQVNWLTATAWFYLSRGDVQQGGSMAERAVLLDSSSSRAHHHFGWALLMIGEIDRAEQEFKKALDLHPENWQAQFALAQVPLRRNKPKEALQRLEGIIRANPGMLAAYQSMAKIYSQIGDSTNARRILEQYRTATESEQTQE